MINLFYDYETYWANGYSLRSMPTIQYVRDERFQVHSCAFKCEELWGEETKYFERGAGLKEFIHDIPWDKVNAIAHNNYFDSMITWEHFNRRPATYGCTLAMARAIFPFAESRALDALSKMLGGRGKAEVDLAKVTKNKQLEELTNEERKLLKIYTIQDVEELEFVYKQMAGAFPQDELDLISQTTRWGTFPTLQVDRPRMAAALEIEAKEREDKIKASGTTKTTLSSNPKFARYLESLGIEVPMKPKVKNGEEVIDKETGNVVLTHAFSKDDAGFQQLQTDYPERQALIAGRIACKSLGNIRRMERFLALSKNKPTTPMPLNYFGAHTGRWSGSDKLNVQNLTRGSEMRKSLVAPPGYKILVVDLSQIELRMNFWFCDELDWLDVIRKCDADPENNPDVYKVSAGNHYNIDPMMIDAGQRFFGKTMELGLGYRMGAPKFRVRCATDKWNPLFLSKEDAYEAVQGYRASHPNVPVMWRTLDNTLAMMANNYTTDIKGLEFHPTHVRLPNGMNLEYPNLGYVPEKDSLMYDKGKYYGFIHGGSFLENLIQAISRIFMGECMLQVERERGGEIFSVSTTHDEGIWLVKDNIAEEAYNYVREIMCTPPKWAPTCPMNAEGGFAREYSK